MINYRKILALLCAMILSLSFTGSFAEEEEEIVIPYLIGMNVSEAIELLNTMGVQHTELYFHNDSVEENTVFMQNPNENEKLLKDDTVMLSVSAGIPQITVPDLQGMNIAEATELAKNSGLYPIRERISGDGSDADTVISQSPAAYEKIDKNSDIILLYGSGESSVPAISVDTRETPDFYESGLKITNILDQMVRNRSFLDLFMSSTDNMEIIDKTFNTGDYDKPVAVYRLNQANMENWIKSMMDDAELDLFNSLSPDLQEQLLVRIKGTSYIASIINAKKGVTIVALTGALQAQLDMPGLEPETTESYLFVFEKGVPVLVSLGWHHATGMFLVLSEEQTKSMETIQASLMPYGLEISQVDIPQA